MKIGDKVKRIREIKGLTQEDLAQKLNITTQAYRYLEQNKTKMDEERLEQIAESLGVSVEIIRNFEPNNLFINSLHAIGDNAKTVINHNENQQLIEIISKAKDEIIAQQKDIITRLQNDNEFLKAQLEQITKLINNK